MSITVNQTSPVASNTSGTVTTTWSANPSATSICIYAFWIDSPPASISVTDNASPSSNTYLAYADTSNVRWVFFTNGTLKLPSVGNLQLTVTPSNTARAGVVGRSYLGLTGALGNKNESSFGASGPPINLSVTPLYTASLFVSVFGTSSSGTSEGLGTSGGNLASLGVFNNGTTGKVGGMADYVAAALESPSVSWTWSAGDSTVNKALIVEFSGTGQLAPTLDTNVFGSTVALKRASVR